MGKVKVSTSSSSRKKMRPALSPESRENQLIALAVDLVEQRLLDGTASSQEVTHFLKLGSTKARLEEEKLKKEIIHLEVKAESIAASQHRDELYKNALEAFRTYSGHGGDQDNEGY